MYPNVCAQYRIALATPCHDKVYKLKFYDESINKFYEVSKKETPRIPISFDCAINHCLISKDCYNMITQDPRSAHITFNCLRNEDVDVMVDGSINFCGSVPDEIFDIKSYKEFENWQECSKYITKTIDDFLKDNTLFCKEVSKCKNKSCPGACFASLINLYKQEEKKPKIIRALNKKRLNLEKWVDALKQEIGK